MKEPVPDVLYKFAKREHAWAMCNLGCFRIGTLYDFRKQESHLVNIGDGGEGKQEVSELIPERSSPMLEAEMSPLLKSLYRSTGPGKGVLSNMILNSSTDLEDRFVFCFSSSRHSEARSSAQYDSVVEIRNPIGFAFELTKAAQLSLATMLEPCRYIGRAFTDGKFPECHPVYLKEPDLEFQCEWRLVWGNTAGRVLEPFNILASATRKFCRIVTIL